MNVVWYTNKNDKTEFESTYIKELLSSYEGEINYYDGNETNEVFANSIIVTNHSRDYTSYIQRYVEKGVCFMVLQISDEGVDVDRRFYDFPKCWRVFRNYCHPKLFNYKNVSYFPMGYNRNILSGYNGKHPLEVPMSERKYVWTFSGGSKPLRGHITRLFAEQFPNEHLYIYETGNSYSNQITGLPIDKYREMLLSSKFCLCPTGGGYNETFRVYEALECGSIPIVLRASNHAYNQKRSYWGDLYGKEPPFVMSDTWEGCIEIIKWLLQNEAIYEKTRQECYDFWQNHKKEKGHEIVRTWREMSSK